MKDIIIILLVMCLFIAIFYILFLKKSIRNFDKKINDKFKSKSKILITSQTSDSDLNRLVNSINGILNEYDDMQIEYTNKNYNLQKMMTNISHDLRTPLTSALGYIDLVLNLNLDENTKIKNLKIIEGRLKRLSELVDSFFDFSKIISNENKIEYTNINIINILEKSISNHYEDFNKNKRTINLVYDNRKVIISSNEKILRRIFDNLIGNAFQHSTSDLDIEVKSVDGIKITFTNGLLNDDLDISRMFDEFYTLDISRTKGNTGLGLAIVKEFVNQLNCEIISKKIENKLCLTIEFN